MLALETLLKQLNKSELNIHNTSEIPTSYKTVNTLTESCKLLSGTLYICLASQVQANDLQHPTIGFIIIPDIPLAATNLIDCEYVIWDYPISVGELFQTIHYEFCKKIGHSLNVSKLFSALVKGSGLSGLIEIGSKLVNNPIIFTNACYRVLVLAGDDREINDPIWQYAKQYGYCSQEAIEKFRNEGITAKTMGSDAPIIFRQGIAEGIPRMIKKVRIQNKVVGYLGVYQINQEFDQQDLDTVDLLAEILAFEMKNDISEEYGTQVTIESIILDLLNQRISGTHLLENRLKAAHWTVKPFVAVVEIPLSEDDQSIWFYDYLCSRLKHCAKEAQIVNYHDSILLVIDCENPNRMKAIIDKITIVLEMHQMKAGISRIFHCLEELDRYHLQACKALELGQLMDNQNSVVYFYVDVALFHLFSSIENNQTLAGVCHPGYQQLQEYDRLNHTDYCHTLYEFIMSTNNVSHSAEKLYIHRNTMSYRLNKISEIMNIDLANGEETFRLILTIKLNQWFKAQGSKETVPNLR